MKVSINLLGIALFVAMLFSCDSTGNEGDSSNAEAVDNAVSENEATEETGFSKFEQYATILTKADLIAQFGAENVVDATETYAEGTAEKKMSVLTNPTNGQVIRYIWADDNTTTAWIEALYTLFDENYEQIGTQKIETESGLWTGMNLLELRDWNGEDFTFSGFGWDYAGGITPSKNSAIYNSPIGMTLDILSMEGAEFTLGDIELNTTDSRLENLDIVIAEFTLSIEK